MNFSSIKTKFMIVALLISLVSFGVAAYISNRWVLDDFQKDYAEKAVLIGRNFNHDLGEGMKSREHEGVGRALAFYEKLPEVEELRIFDVKGEETFVSGKGTPEFRVGEALSKKKIIHFRKQIGQRNVSTFVIPIRNELECQGCHGKTEAFRGALVMSFSLREMEKVVWQHRKRFFFLFGIIAVVIGVMTHMAANRFLVKRLRPIQVGAEAIEGGDFGYRVPVKSGDEIGNLTRYVNRMAQKLRSFFMELEDKNRQLTEQFALVSRSQKEWQETFDCITDPVAVFDQNQRLIRANRALKETFQASFSQGQGGMIDFLFKGKEPFNFKGGPVTSREIHHEATGKIFDVSLFPYHSEEGNLTGSVVILKDITRKKEDEMGLIMTERLAALGQMASGIAHEINTPLATIAACNEGLLNRVERENIGSLLFRSYLKIIEEEIERCKKITSGMLSFVKRTDHQKREIDVNEVLDKTLDMVSFQGRIKDVEVSSSLQRRIPKVLGNDGELMQVFLSIVVNALDAMGDKGTLTLETGVENGERVLSSTNPPLEKGGQGGFVFIKITDTGPGIRPDVVTRIFDPFFTTKSDKGGTGLGLSIANKIVKEYNGRIDVASEEGKGAAFKIILPV